MARPWASAMRGEPGSLNYHSNRCRSKSDRLPRCRHHPDSLLHLPKCRVGLVCLPVPATFWCPMFPLCAPLQVMLLYTVRSSWFVGSQRGWYSHRLEVLCNPTFRCNFVLVVLLHVIQSRTSQCCTLGNSFRLTWFGCLWPDLLPFLPFPIVVLQLNFRGMLFLCQVVPPQIVIAWLTNWLAHMMYHPITTQWTHGMLQECPETCNFS